MEITTTTAQRIHEGRTVFVKDGDDWMIAGPAKRIWAGRAVMVTKASGQQTQVLVGEIVETGSYTADRLYGVEYKIATVARPARTQAPQSAEVNPSRDWAPRTARGRFCQHCGERIWAGQCEGCGTRA